MHGSKLNLLLLYADDPAAYRDPHVDARYDSYERGANRDDASIAIDRLLLCAKESTGLVLWVECED